MSQKTAVMRRGQYKIKMVVNSWEVKQNEVGKHTNFAY